MWTYTLRRLALLVPTLIGITFITFLIVSLAPGNPADVVQGNSQTMRMSEETYQEMQKLYGLDKPWYQRYFVWVVRLVTFDFGNSFLDHRPVTTKIWERLPATLLLNLVSLILIVLISVPFGLYSALRQNSRFDKVGGAVLYMMYSLPEFWVALMLIILFGVKLQALPFIGKESFGAGDLSFLPYLWDRILHLILPVASLTFGALAFLSRFVRGSTLEVVRQDYIRTARAKGLTDRQVVYKHILRNTLIPLVTLLGILLPTLISGSVIIEMIFSWPGIGQLFYDAVLSRDYPTVMGLSFFTAVLVLLSTLVADLLYTWVDPRIAYE